MGKRTIIVGAFAVAALNIAFPPWHLIGKIRKVDLGYWFLVSPPQYVLSNGVTYTGSINVTQLLLQIAVVVLVAGGVYFAVGKD